MKGIILSSEFKEAANIKQICLDYGNQVEIIDIFQTVADFPEYSLGQIDIILADADLISTDSSDALQAFLEQYQVDIIFYSRDKKLAYKTWAFFPIAYLLLPLTKQKLQSAFQRLAKRRLKQIEYPFSKPLQDTLKKNKIALPLTEGFLLVKPEEIIRCEAQGGYTQVFLKDESSLLITKTLKHYHAILEALNFFRIHKSHLVNLKYVRKFIKGKQGYIEITDGKILEVSSRKREELLQKLSVM